MINGYARVVLYEVHSFNIQLDNYDPLRESHFNRIISLHEGNFQDSLIQGFGREVDVQNSVIKLGFFHNGWPHGKMIEYHLGKIV